jgi:hypothetical protein
MNMNSPDMHGARENAATTTHGTRELLTRAFQLRAETVEIAALPEATPAFNAIWSFGAAASTLIRTVDRLVEDGASVDARLDAIAEACEPHPPRVATVAGQPAPHISSLVD